MRQQLERIQARAEMLQAHVAAQLGRGGLEGLGLAQVGEHLGLRRLQPQAVAGHVVGGQLPGDEVEQAVVGEGCRADLDYHARVVAVALAFGQHLDGAVHHPAVDGVEQAVVLGDADEGLRLHDLAVGLQAQQRLVDLAGLGLQADHGLVMQAEAVVLQRFAQALDPVLHTLFFGAVDGARIEDLEAVAAQVGGRLQAVRRARQHGADAGDLLADLHAAQAGGHRGRAFAHVEHVRGIGRAELLGQGGGVGVVAAQQDGERALAEAGRDAAVVQLLGQARRQRGGQVVGRIDADVGQQALVVVGFDQQQAVLVFATGHRGHRRLQLAQEGGAVEQAGDHVALAQVLHLAGQFGIELLAAAEHHLHAGLALVGGGGEFQRGRETVAVQAARFQLEARRRRFALAELLQQGLEVADVLRAHQVQQREAFHILERLEAEHLQVGIVGPDVHAFVDVGDRVARGRDQCVAPALGLAHLAFQAALRTARIQVGPLPPQYGQHVVRPPAQGDRACAGRLVGQQVGLGDGIGQHDDGDVLAAPVDLCQYRGQRNALGGAGGQQQVHGLGRHHLSQFAGVERPQGAHGDAAVAQGGHDGLGVFGAVVHEGQSKGGVFADLHAAGPPGVRV